MPPLEGKNGTAAVFLFGQGASIPTELYEPLGLALQQAAPYPLWFASPQCLDNGACFFVSFILKFVLSTGLFLPPSSWHMHPSGVLSISIPSMAP